MTSSKNKKVSSVMITGANAGLGFETARQLAMKEEITKIVLACRNPAKAEDAKKQLEVITKKNIFEVLILDVSNLDSVRKAVNEMKQPVDGLIMNAGGTGGPDSSRMTEYGVPSMFASNVLGHVLLVDLLLEQKKLTRSVIYAGTEASRGIPLMDMKRPDLKNGSVEEMESVCDGTYFGKDQNFESMYGHGKLMGTLWMSSMARKDPNATTMRFITISPGGTTGTTFFRDMPKIKQILLRVLMPMMELLGKMHSLEVGAKRYIDALLDEVNFQTGIFYASEKGTTGKVSDQETYLPILHDHKYQDNANMAIHKFIS